MKEGNYDIMYSGSHDFFFNIYLQLCNQDFLLGFTVNLTEISSILKKINKKIHCHVRVCHWGMGYTFSDYMHS